MMICDMISVAVAYPSGWGGRREGVMVIATPPPLREPEKFFNVMKINAATENSF